MDIELITGRQWPEAIEQLLRSLPEWFGIEQALLDYVEHSRTLPTTAALDGDEVVGACVVRRHFPRSAEIELLAVRRDRHRQGIGRRLVEHVAGTASSGMTRIRHGFSSSQSSRSSSRGMKPMAS